MEGESAAMGGQREDFCRDCGAATRRAAERAESCESHRATKARQLRANWGEKKASSRKHQAQCHQAERDCDRR